MKKLLITFLAGLIAITSAASALALTPQEEYLITLNTIHPDVTKNVFPDEFVELAYLTFEPVDYTESVYINQLTFEFAGEGTAEISEFYLLDMDTNTRVKTFSSPNMNETYKFDVQKTIQEDQYTEGYRVYAKMRPEDTFISDRLFNVDVALWSVQAEDKEGRYLDSVLSKKKQTQFITKKEMEVKPVELSSDRNPSPISILANGSTREVLRMEMNNQNDVFIQELEFSITNDLLQNVATTYLSDNYGNGFDIEREIQYNDYTSVHFQVEKVYQPGNQTFYLDLQPKSSSQATQQGAVTLQNIIGDYKDQSTDLPIQTSGPVISSGQITISPSNNYNNIFADFTKEIAEDLKGRAATYLYQQGMIGGYAGEDGTSEFRGYNTLNRAEAAKFLINSLDLDESEFCSYSVAPDVFNNQWYTPYVCTANKLGMMTGHPDGTFRPGDKVTKAEYTKMLVEAHNLKACDTDQYDDVSKSNDWFTYYALAAKCNHIFPEDQTYFDGNYPINRYQTAIGIYQVLKAGLLKDRQNVTQVQTISDQPSGYSVSSARIMFESVLSVKYSFSGCGSRDFDLQWDGTFQGDTANLYLIDKNYDPDPNIIRCEMFTNGYVEYSLAKIKEAYLADDPTATKLLKINLYQSTTDQSPNTMQTYLNQ